MFCLICDKFFELNEEVRAHVLKDHPKAMFTSSMKRVHTTECKKAQLHDDASTSKKGLFRHSFIKDRDGLTKVREIPSSTECKCVICRGIEEDEPAEKRRDVHDDACICQYCKPLGAEWQTDD